MNIPNWYALYTKPRWEKKVASVLEINGFDIYCPVAKQLRQWSDRKKVVLEPVFRGYVFIYVDKNKLWDAVKFSGILSVVKHLGKPAIIREEEIDTIRKFLNEFENVEVRNIAIDENAKVRIKQGVLMNYEGIVLEVFGNTATVKINSLGLQLTAQFDKKNLEKIN